MQGELQHHTHNTYLFVSLYQGLDQGKYIYHLRVSVEISYQESLNFHYLPYGARFAFLQQLQTYASNAKFDQSTKIQASYSSIKNNKYTKVAIKRYLYSQVRSNFLRIDVNEMALAAYLPVAQFTGKTIGGVFSAARKNF